MELVLPVLLIGGALLFTDRACRWYGPGVANYTPVITSPPHSSNSSYTSPKRSVGGATSRRPAAVPKSAPDEGRPKVNIVVGVEVNSDGLPTAVRIVRGAGGVADQRAIAQVKKMRFEPVKRNGVTNFEIAVSVPIS